MLVTIISSQSRQETFVSPKSAPRDKQTIRSLVYKIIALILIPIIVFSTISHIESLSDRQIADLLEIFNFSKFGTPLNSALIVFLLLLFGFFAFFPIIRLIQKFFSALTGKYFVISLAALAVLGAVAALYIPSYTNWFKPDTQQSTSSTQNGQGSGNQQNQSSKDPSSDLRLHLLYITGGIIAVLGLIETNRKNSQDHIREVHAARRDRYIEAVDKLSSDDAPVRLGGVYALVGLVDEWLDDDNIDEETRIKEGQIIINNLCSYIRSPFLIAEKIEAYEASKDFNLLQEYEAEFSLEEYSPQLRALYERFKESGTFKDFQDITADYAKFHEEQDVRRTIFVEMSKRSSTFTKNEKGDMIPSRGTWSEFEFDFSRASIFYPLNHLTIEKGIFSYASFYGQADFNESTFMRDAAFNGVKFTQGANFAEVTFNGEADFSAQGDTKTTFGGDAAFNGTHFAQGANFTEVTFNGEADFSAQGDTKTTFGRKAPFGRKAAFNGTHFAQGANFTEVTFNGEADFSAQGDTKTTFGGKVTFNSTQFKKTALFNKTIFNETNFSGSTMNKTVFTMDAIFAGTEFTKNTSFNNVEFNGLADFSSHSQDLIQPITFGANTEFIETIFCGKADFSSLIARTNTGLPSDSTKLIFNKVSFNDEAIFKGSQIALDTVFEETKFCGIANFEYAIFSGATKFTRKTIFKQEANFNSSEFHISLEINALFEESVNFISTIFGPESSSLQKIVFNKSRFDGDTDFSDAHFNLDTDFIDVIFEGETNFTESVFLGNSSFTRSHDGRNITGQGLFSKFRKEARFQGADFIGSVDFSHMQFCSSAIFEEAKFGSDTYFNNMYFDTIPPDFKDAEFEAKSKHSFTTNSNSKKQFNLRAIKPNSKGQTVWLPSGSFLFTGTPGNQRIGPA